MRTATLLAGAFCLLGLGSAAFAESTSPDTNSSVPAAKAPCPAGEQPADKGCDATPPANTSEQSKSSSEESKSSSGQSRALEPATPSTERPQSKTPISDEVADATKDPVICKRVKVTGSHVRKTEVCQKQSEWVASRDAAKKMMDDANQKRAPNIRKGPSAP